jgi:transposase
MIKHKKMQYTYVGLDSHKETHTAVFLDCFFEKLGEITFPNRPAAFPKFLLDATALRQEGTQLLFGMEDISAYGRALTVSLLDHGLKVKHVNALLVAKERKNQNHTEKTDTIDAACAARILLSRFDTLPDADVQDRYMALRSLVIRRNGIVKNNIALKNQLHTLLMSHYPSYTDFFASIDSNTALTFFETYPSPSTLAGTTQEALTDMLFQLSYGRVTAEKTRQICVCIQEDDRTETGYQDIRNFTVRSVIRHIRFNTQEAELLEQSMEQFLSHFDCTLTTMNGIDVITAANLLSCIGDIKKFSTPAKLARYAGIAPVTHASGKRDLQYASQRGNRELGAIFYALAVRLTMRVGKGGRVMNPFFYEYYHRKLSEGKTKRQALKSVQRRLVNIIWSMLTHSEEYVNPPMYDRPKDTPNPQK